eukprot:scaffold34871_cov60-Phaeocystis_antarctica.AAC.1
MEAGCTHTQGHRPPPRPTPVTAHLERHTMYSSAICSPPRAARPRRYFLVTSTLLVTTYLEQGVHGVPSS